MGKAVLRGIRNCILGAIIVVGAAIVVGGMTDIVPAETWEPLAESFRHAFLLLFASPPGLRVSWQTFASHSSGAGTVAFVLLFDAAAARRSVIRARFAHVFSSRRSAGATA